MDKLFKKFNNRKGKLVKIRINYSKLKYII